MCENCGQEVIVRQDQNNAVVLNHIKYEDAKKGISLDARITDNFGANAAAVVGMLRGGQMPARLPTRVPRAIPGQEELFEAAEVMPDSPTNTPPTPLAIQTPLTQPNKLVGADSYLHSLFTQRDEKWRLVNPNLKAKNKGEFVQRATCLFLQMQQDLGNESASRADVTQMLKDCGVFDSNFRAWLAKEKTLLRANANDITIIMPGTQYVAEILAEIFDENIPNPWKLGTVTKSGRKSGKKDRGQQGAQENESN